MQEISRETLVQASRGDVESFESVYRAFSGFVYNVVFRVVNHAEDAEEVTQDVFLNVYRKLGSFGFKSSVKTWIYRIAVNSAINRAKKRSRERERNAEYGDHMDSILPAPPADEPMNREEEERVVSRLLDALNPDQRSCLVLRDFEGLSYEEISKALKININTVRSRLKRAREKLLALRNEVIANEL